MVAVAGIRGTIEGQGAIEKTKPNNGTASMRKSQEKKGAERERREEGGRRVGGPPGGSVEAAGTGRRRRVRGEVGTDTFIERKIKE